MEQKRAYKYRFYPTDEQKHTLARTFGCCRVVYNWALLQKTDAYHNEQKRLYYKDLSAMLPELKKQQAYQWLSEVASVPLQQSLRHLDKAFLNFFEGRGEYPKLRSDLRNPLPFRHGEDAKLRYKTRHERPDRW